MGFADALEDLGGGLTKDLNRHRAFAADVAAEGFAFDVFHGDEGAVFVAAKVVDGDDVGVVEGAEALGFAFEAGDGFFVFDEVTAEDFDNDFAVEGALAAEVNGAHAAATDAAVDEVAACDGFADKVLGIGVFPEPLLILV